MELERVIDVISLLPREKQRLQQLEGLIETHLGAFLAVGRALGEIRSSRLYRERYITFDQYVRDRWGMQRSRADELIRTVGCADMLLESTGSVDGQTPLPADVPEAVLRSLSAVPSQELRQATWRLLAKASPNGKPTRVVARSICKLIRQAVNPEKNTPQQVPFQPLFVRPFIGWPAWTSTSALPVCTPVPRSRRRRLFLLAKS